MAGKIKHPDLGVGGHTEALFEDDSYHLVGGVADKEVLTTTDVELGADVTDATNVNAAGAVMETDYDANTILAANADNTPLPLTITAQSVVARAAGNIAPIAVAASQILGRTAASDLKGMTVAEVNTLLGVDVLVEDAAYGAGWDGDTTHAPSQNAVYDKIQSIVAGAAGSRGFTITIAGHTASADVIAQSDYQCDGVDDDVEFNAAIAALPVRTSICTIKAIGHFHPSDVITLASHICMDLTEASFEWNYNSGGDSAKALFVATGTEDGTDDIALTVNAVAGDYTITIAGGEESHFAVGDYVLIKDEGTVIGANYDGEIHRVVATGAGLITLDTNLWYGYNTADTAHIQVINTVDDVVIDGGEINGSDPDAANEVYGVTFTYASNFSITGMKFNSNSASCIYLRSCLFGDISANHIWGSAHGDAVGIAVVAACHSLTLRGNHLSYCTQPFGGGPYTVTSHLHGAPMFILWEGNTVIGNVVDGHAFDLHSSRSKGLVYRNNVISLAGTNSNAFGIGALEWSCEGNVIDCTGNAFYDRDDPSTVNEVITLKNNIIIRGSGVSFNGANLTNITIDGLVFLSALTGYAVYCTTDVAASYITVKNVKALSGGSGANPGILVDDFAHVNVCGNEIRGFQRAGILITDATKGLVENNICSNNDKAASSTESRRGGIALGVCSNLLVTGNECFDDNTGSETQKYGIEEYTGSDSNVISNNKCWGNVTGSYLITGASTTVAGYDTKGLTFDSSQDSAAVADQVTIGGYDISAGHRALAISSEEVVVAETDESKMSHKLPVRINGATLNIMLCDT